MKKNEVKKLRLSRETLKALTSTDAQKVIGGCCVHQTDHVCPLSVEVC